MNERLATSATKCLENILMHAPWREEFEGFLVKQLLCVWIVLGVQGSICDEFTI